MLEFEQSRLYIDAVKPTAFAFNCCDVGERGRMEEREGQQERKEDQQEEVKIRISGREEAGRDA